MAKETSKRKTSTATVATIAVGAGSKLALASAAIAAVAAVLRVTAKMDGVIRLGIPFGSEPVDVPLAELNDVQRDHLMNDALLVVEIVAPDAPPAPIKPEQDPPPPPPSQDPPQDPPPPPPPDDPGNT